MKRHPHPLILLACAAWGCGVGFSAPLASTAAELRMNVSLVDSSPVGEAHVSGSLWPGFDQYGDVRSLADSSVQLLGRTITPSIGAVTQEQDGIPYSDQWGLNPDLPVGALELQAPEVPGAGEIAPVLRLSPPWRAGAGAVTVAAGSTLLLPLLVEAQPGDTVHESWRLELFKDGQYLSALDATGPTPATIEVPWSMLAGLGTGGEARLTVQQSVATPADGRQYSASLFVTTTHYWLITVQP